MKNSIIVAAFTSAILLTACGGGGGGGGGEVVTGASGSGGGGNRGSGSTTPRNVALAANGGAATANFDNANAGFVNDGATSGNFWAGGGTGDFVTVTFNASYSASQIKLFTNARNNVDTQILVSANGTTFTELEYVGGSNVDKCSSFSTSNTESSITCGLNPQRDLRAVRIRIDASDPTATQIREIQVLGE